MKAQVQEVRPDKCPMQELLEKLEGMVTKGRCPYPDKVWLLEVIHSAQCLVGQNQQKMQEIL